IKLKSYLMIKNSASRWVQLGVNGLKRSSVGIIQKRTSCSPMRCSSSRVPSNLNCSFLALLSKTQRNRTGQEYQARVRRHRNSPTHRGSIEITVVIFRMEGHRIAICRARVDQNQSMTIVTRIDSLCLIHAVSWGTDLDIVSLRPGISSKSLIARN